MVADGIHQVGLAQADAPVNEQRIVGTGGGFRHCHAGRMRELVARADYKTRKRVLGVQVHQPPLASGLRASNRRRLWRPPVTLGLLTPAEAPTPPPPPPPHPQG